MSSWLIFALSASVIILAGRKLSHYGDEIATHTGLGRAWVGSILLAGATSLPEVATSMASAHAGWGNLAMGNVFGSNIFNIAILVLAQLFGTRPILAHVGNGHTTVATAGILLSGIAAMAMLVRYPITFLGAGVDTWLILVTYLLVLRLLPREEQGGAPDLAAAGPGPARRGAGGLWVKFVLAAAAVVGAGWYLSQAADQIAVQTGLGQTFVGGTLLAAATSLPELTVTIVTVRNGAYDLALGNVLGSNIFNMLILVLSDFAMPGPQPILSTATTGQAIAAMLGLVLSGITVLALTVPNRASQRRFQWDMAAIAATYLAGTWFLYTLR